MTPARSIAPPARPLPPPREAASLVEILRWRALHQGERRAFLFLREGEHEEAWWSYEHLDRQARAIAAHLLEAGARGERVLLLYPSGLAFVAAFLGCLYAGAIAVPAPPPHWRRNMGRLENLLGAARPQLWLTTAALRQTLRPLLEGTGLGSLRCLATDALETAAAARWPEFWPEGEQLAFLQYTSGSTARPKGVMISHRNLLRNHGMLQEAFQQTESSVLVSWLPLFHDMGLIGNMLQAIFLGAPAVLMAPEAFLMKPGRWLHAISRYGGHTSGAPNFAYELCALKIGAEQKAGLDLSGWAYAYVAAEPVRPRTLERFAEAFAGCGFRRAALFPGYGLAEATVFVTGSAKPQGPRAAAFSAEDLHLGRARPASTGEEARQLVSCGHPWQEGRVAIAHPHSGARCAPGEIGEIWVAGPHVAGGYWNQPAETAATFGAFLAEPREGPFLRTGDLGFLDGEGLFITGRLKDLIIIAGRNHYPQDLEETTEASHPALRRGGSAAFAVEWEGEERLAIAAEVERTARGKLDVAGVRGAIREALAQEHGVSLQALVLLKPGSLPKTSSGKIQRQACRAAWAAGPWPGQISETP